jgi:membrane protease YdiL (CAAX protease family)
LNRHTRVIFAVVLSFLLWYVVFLSDLLWSFWYRVTFSSIILSCYAYLIGKASLKEVRFGKEDILKGLGSGFALYGLFNIGFNVFRTLVAGGASNVYLYRSELPLFVPATLLLVTSFCEEFFWRHYIQNNIFERYGFKGIVLTTALYSAIHLPTMNLPLVAAAFIAGLAWGLMYRYTRSLPLVVFSHIAWTELIFVFLPLG